MRKPYPSEKQERFIVRLPDGMRDQIAEAAKSNNRTMNAEVVSRLQKSFEAEQRQLLSEIRRMRPDGTSFIDEEALVELLDKRLSNIEDKLSDFEERVLDGFEKRFAFSNRSPGMLKSPKA